MRLRLSDIFAWLAYSLGAVLMGGAALESFVYIPNWLHDTPRSLEVTRAFLAVRTPGDFFQLIAPLLVLTSIGAVVLAWPHRRVRNALLAGLVLMIVAEALTFVFVYPHFPVLLSADVALRPPAEIQAAADDLLFWGWWVRIPIMVLSVFGCYLPAARWMTVAAAARR